MSASVSAPDPPRGTDQLRPCRPKMIEYALTPEPGGVHGHERLERLPDHERLDVAVLELAPDHVPGRDRVAPQPDPPARVLEQHFLERGAEARRRDARAAEDPLDLVVLADQAPVGLGVGPREARDLVACAVEVEPHRELLAVRKRHVPDRVGLEVLEPVVGVEPELVVHEQRVHADDRVPGRAGVDPVAGPEQLLGRGPAARYRARVEDEAFVAGLRQVRRGDQAVVAGAGHHDVSCLRHRLQQPLGIAGEDRGLHVGRQPQCAHGVHVPCIPHVERIVGAEQHVVAARRSRSALAAAARRA